jgi:hypothetical protein
VPCTLRRPGRPRAHRHDRLRPGLAAAPDEPRLALLPSGPDAVRVSPLRGTRSSTPFAPAALEDEDLGREFSPAGADCRYRAPLVPRLARQRDHSRGPGRSSRAGEGGGGEGGIRTLDGLPHTAFPVRRPRPLGDLSAGMSAPGPAGRVRGVAERVGFEPTVLAHTAFRERHLQPLGHLSAREDTKGERTRDWEALRVVARQPGPGDPRAAAGSLQARVATSSSSAASARRIPETRSIRRRNPGWSASWITEPAAPAVGFEAA